MVESPRVAVIGAGISGIVTAGHLLDAGIQVTVFERNSAAGGVWLYDKRTPLETRYPYQKLSASQEYVKDNRGDEERKRLLHAPPGPCYESLTNNISTPLLQTRLNGWPEGTPAFVKHHVVKDYIQDTSRKAGVDQITTYGARVTRVHKQGATWTVHWSTLSDDNDQGPIEKRESMTFDSVVVASGHYHTPLIPNIPGLSEAKSRWPESIFHSKSFRKSEGFEGKNVLLLGGGISALDIAKELSTTAHWIYQSTRNGAFDLPETALPPNASRIGEVHAFEVSTLAGSPDNKHLPLTVHLRTGETLNNIDQIILCTGYHMALPFLDDYNDYRLSATDADDRVLVTDGTQVHNLHEDIFYIPDPTLAFVGIPFYVATFSLFEFQAIAITAFLSGVAQLPSALRLRTEYENRVQAKGYGRSLHSLKNQEQAYATELMKWVNAGRVERGLSVIEDHTETWIKEKVALDKRLKLLLAGQLSQADILKSPLEIGVVA